MNLITIPFHDWRKYTRFGARTRDLHFIEHFGKNKRVQKVLVINRPITWAEAVLRRTSWRTPGTAIYRTSNLNLAQVSEKIYVLDYLSNQIMQNILLGRRWYFSSYGIGNFMRGVFKACDVLDMPEYHVMSLSIYAYLLCEEIRGKAPDSRLVFDAWDNWTRFPAFSKYILDIHKAYRTYQTVCQAWITNSDKNKEYFQGNFHVAQSIVIRNGVDPELFQKEYKIPHDMKNIKQPIIGFGGKISHLLDEDLVNYLTAENPDLHFVMIGEILDSNKFKKIISRRNFHYLGDKHYDDYPAYIKNFDVCILPYHINEREHGGDSIKLYEYISANKPIVATNGNGAEKLLCWVNIASDYKGFSELIRKCIREQKSQDVLTGEFTWRYKADQIIDLLEKS